MLSLGGGELREKVFELSVVRASRVLVVFFDAELFLLLHFVEQGGFFLR